MTIGPYTTEFLTNFVRDNQVLSLEKAHYRLSCLPAKVSGFVDRGVLAEGRPAETACAPARPRAGCCGTGTPEAPHADSASDDCPIPRPPARVTLEKNANPPEAV
ncbi:MAG: hypothetical protein AB7O21_16200 [Gammaproteobacteria bacterium]